MATSPRQKDVLFGKGTAINGHPGNQRFRSIVAEHKPRFREAQRDQKRSVAAEVYDEIHRLGGRFLMEDPNSNGCFIHYGDTYNNKYNNNKGGNENNFIHPCIRYKAWVGVEKEKVITKVMHRLREKGVRAGSKPGTTKSTPQPQNNTPHVDSPKKTQHETEHKKEGPGAQFQVDPRACGTGNIEEGSKPNFVSGTQLSDAGQSEGLGSSIGGQLTKTEAEGSDNRQFHSKEEPERFKLLDDQPTPGLHEEPERSELLDQPGTGLHAENNEQMFDSDLSKHDRIILHVDRILRFQNAQESEGEAGEEEEEETKMASLRTPVKVVNNELLLEDKIYDSAGQEAKKVSSLTSTTTAKVVNNGLLEEELGDLLLHFSSDHDDVIAEPFEEGEDVHEGTLREWVEKSKPSKSTSNNTSSLGVVMGYVEKALPIALKLTECLIEAEKDGQQNDGNNPIPLASINAANVLVRTRNEVHSSEGSSANGSSEGSSANGSKEDVPSSQIEEISKALRRNKEVVDYVWIMSCMGDDPDAGGTIPRLFALGLVLHELFTGEEPSISHEESFDNLLSMNSISLHDNVDGSNRHRPRKKTQRPEIDACSKCVTEIRRMGIPQSVCALMENLMDLSRGDACGDDAYSSFDDLRGDLQLMMERPERFLYNIQTSPLPPLVICSKLYEREDELGQLERSFGEHNLGNCDGVIIKGKAGVGKSKLAMHVGELSRASNGYFLVAKFDQNQNAHPLATVGSLLNSLCDLFVRDATDAKLKAARESLESALGDQSALLFGVIPSLMKLLPSCRDLSSIADLELSMKFLFSEILRVISSHSRHISFFLDDMHWSDPLSLLVMEGLISNSVGRKSVFFTCSYRADEIHGNKPFDQWLSSMSMLSLETIGLQNMSVTGVNMLVSDALHLSPRITRPLSSIVHHKAGGGNPLFVNRLLDSLREKGYIYVDLSYPKWDFDLSRIMELEISDDVLALLIEEMQKLHPTLQLGLQLVSCIGSYVKHTVLDILSQDLEQNLYEILCQVSRKGFMNNVGGTMFSFSHDKIQQAAYEMMPEQERRENHMRLGLAICSHSLSTSAENNELFFTSVHQINLGGPRVLSNPDQRRMIAALNLKAGRRCADLSDLTTAFQLFKHGISFLGDDNWNSDYDLSLNLYDAISDVACATNNGPAVNLYTKQLIAKAKCSDDKLNCLYAVAKTLSNMGLVQDAMTSTFGVLLQLGEVLPRTLGDPGLNADVDTMNAFLENTTDEVILNKGEAVNQKKCTILMNLYNLLAYTFDAIKPDLFGAASLRMVELSVHQGINFRSPIAFALYGKFMVSIGKLDLGVRLGRLALELVEKKGFFRAKVPVIVLVHTSILWLSLPMQAIADAIFTGYRASQQTGEFMLQLVTYFFFLNVNYMMGQNLNKLRENCRKSALKATHKNVKHTPFGDQYCQLHAQACVLVEGLHLLDAREIDDVPCNEDMFQKPKGIKKLTQLISIHIHWLVRTLRFRQFDSSGEVCFISEMLAKKRLPFLNPTILFGMFFEGLVAYELAGQARDKDESLPWNAKGDSVLFKMQAWNDHCPWNFENKLLLLKANRMSILGEFDKAGYLYESSIRSAHDHEFIHEEAIASEMAGHFYHERGLGVKSYSFFMHSIECYKKWGALAVARRVERDVQSQFCSDLTHIGLINDSLASIFASEEGSSKKRQSGEI